MADSRLPGPAPQEPTQPANSEGTRPHDSHASRTPLLSHRTARLNGAERIDPDTPTRPMGNGASSGDARNRDLRGADPAFGDYELMEVIARGGMGVVYKAWHRTLQRVVALKMILAGQLASEMEVLRFRQEATAAARLDHPSIVPIYAVGEEDGKLYYSMAYMEKGSLAARIKDKPLDPDEAAAIVQQVAVAVDHAHQHDIIHRDIKPSNILLDKDGRPKVSDFGLAKKLSESSQLTMSGEAVGTPQYMSPEQAAGKNEEVGHASDIYSLGALLYSLMTGRPPFHAANSLETLRQVTEQEPVSPRTLNTAIKRDLETICLKCLQKQPGKRYSSARALAEDIDRYRAGKPITARPVGRPERAWRWCLRNPVVTGLLTTVAMALIAGTAVSTFFAIRAIRGEELAEQRAYAATTNLVHKAWEDGQIGWAEKLLDGLNPDLRHFEWHYLRKLSRLDLRTLNHGGPVSCVAYSPDRRFIASASDDPSTLTCKTSYDSQANAQPAVPPGEDICVKVWDAESGKLVWKLPIKAKRIPCVAFSRDSRHLAACGGRTVKIWQVESGAELPHLPSASECPGALAFTPDNLLIYSNGADIRVWNPQAGRCLQTLRGHRESIWCLAISPDGRKLASGASAESMPGGQSTPSELFIWDLTKGQTYKRLAGHAKPILGVCFSPDGTQLASASWDHTVRLWDAETGARGLVLGGNTTFYGVAFSPDGKRVTATTGNGYDLVRIWNVANGTEDFALRGHTRTVRAVAFSPDGSRLVTGSLDGTVKFWDATQTRERRVLRLENATKAVFHESGRIAWCSLDGELKVGKVGNQKADITVKAHPGLVFVLAQTRDGRLLATVDKDAIIKVWNALDGTLVQTFAGHPQSVVNIVFSPDGQWVASASDDGTIKVWDTTTGMERIMFQENGRCIRCLAWSADGRHLACTRADNSIVIRDVAGGKTAYVLQGHEASVTCLAFSEDGRSLASSSSDKTVIIWDTGTRRQTRVLHHPSFVSSVALSRDGLRVASLCLDGESQVRIWDACSGLETMALPVSSSESGDLAFSQDSRQLFFTFHATVVIWDATASSH